MGDEQAAAFFSRTPRPGFRDSTSVGRQEMPEPDYSSGDGLGFWGVFCGIALLAAAFVWWKGCH